MDFGGFSILYFFLFFFSFFFANQITRQDRYFFFVFFFLEINHSIRNVVLRGHSLLGEPGGHAIIYTVVLEDALSEEAVVLRAEKDC